MNMLLHAWRKFFFEPIPLTALALFRIAFGCLVLHSLVFQIGADFPIWYGPNAVLTIESTSKYYWVGRPFFDLMLFFSHEESLMLAYYLSAILAAVFLTLGFVTRYSAVWVCLALLSLFNHNPYIYNGGDALLKLNSIFLAASPCGEAFSVDFYLRKKRQEITKPSLYFPWAQRMIQLQLAFVYASTFCWKIAGEQWQRGTAVYYAVRLEDLIRLPLPFVFDNLLCCQILTYFTLAIELAGFTLIWYKPLRYYVLAGLFMLHFGIDIFLNLPDFEWIFISALILFIEPNDLDRWINAVRIRMHAILSRLLPSAQSNNVAGN